MLLVPKILCMPGRSRKGGAKCISKKTKRDEIKTQLQPVAFINERMNKALET